MLRTLILAVVLAFPVSAMAKPTSTTLKIAGWHCEGCTASTRSALERLPGVTGVKTDLEAGTATIDYDDEKVNREQFEQAVAKAGYKLAK